MFNRTNHTPTHHEVVTDLVLSKMETVEPGTTDFTTLVDQYDKLAKHSPKKESWFKPELIIPAAANIGGILAIINYERIHVVSTKAMSLLVKSRL